tara:strand:- start:52 stop:5265 length:5214 start_codon:yes stop_codon:yes gene_type:complete
MTDSNLNINLEEDTEKNEQNVNTTNVNTTDLATDELINKEEILSDTVIEHEEKESITNQYQDTTFSNLLKNDTLDQSFLNFDTKYDFSDFVNSTLMEGEPFDFASANFDYPANIFEDLQLEEGDEIGTKITPAQIKHLSFYQFMKGDQFTDSGFKNKPIIRPNDRKDFDKIFEEYTGYSGGEFFNNSIPVDVINSDKFQTDLDRVIEYYENKGFKFNILELEDNELKKVGKSLGINIGGGIAFDYIFAPFLVSPKGWPIYFTGQFIVGYELDLAAQRAELGIPTNYTGSIELNHKRAIAAGFIQMFPYGVTQKGWKGFTKAVGFGSTLGVSETFMRDLMGDETIRSSDYWTSLGLGGAFGGFFKLGIDGLEGVLKKFEGFSLKNIDDVDLTKKDIETLDESTKVIKEGVDATNNKLEEESGNKDVFDEQLKEELSGSKVKDTVEVKVEDTIDRNIKEGRKLKQEVKVKNTEVIETQTFVAPENYARTKPRYGSALLKFQSDFDKLSWSLRNGRKVKAQNDGKILKIFLDQGFTEKEVRLHGDKVHAKIKSIVKEIKGNASATASNTKGLDLDIPILKDYAGKVQTKLNKLSTDTDLDLGNTQLNPQKMQRIKDMSSDKQDLITGKVRKKKEEGGFKGSERKSQFETQESALNKMTNKDGKISIDKKNMKFFREYTQRKAALEDKLPTDEEVFINSQSLQIAVDKVTKANNDFLAIIKKTKLKRTKTAIKQRQRALQKLLRANYDVDEWLSMGIVKATQIGRWFKTLGMKPIEGIEGMTPAEVMGLSPAQKKKLSSVNEVSPNLNRLLQNSKELQENLQTALQRGEETGDFSDLIHYSMITEEASKNIEAFTTLQSSGAFLKIFSLRNAGQLSRIVNEIGINGVLSGLTSQKVNLYSGIAQTMIKTMGNFIGSIDMNGRTPLIRKEGIEAATKHFFALMYNLDFSMRVWKRSWDMEDNFINVGNSKIETGQRFVISSNHPFFPLRTAINSTGKFIRLPSRLMTANDALIQTPNIIASTAYHATQEAIRKGLKGQDLNDYVKGSIDGVIQYLLKGQEGELGRLKPLEKNLFDKTQIGPKEFIADPLLAKIFQRAKNFGKEITYTQDIRGGRSDSVTDLIGLGAEELNNLAIRYPPIRTLFKFTRTPTNMIKDGLRYVPIVNTPLKFGGRTNYNPLNKRLLPELAADLRSPDPQVRTQTRSQIYMGNAFGVVIAILAYNKILQPAHEFMAASEYSNEDEIPRTFLTDGGPNWRTKEGAAKYISLLKSGWLPYARAYLLYDEDGEILFGDDGQPVYKYVTYEHLPEPILSFVKLMVDFQVMSPFLTEKQDRLYDEFTIGWGAWIGRHITERSYVRQISETINLFTALPEIGTNADPDSDLNYETKRNIAYTGRLVESSITPYSSLVEDLNRMPADLVAAILDIKEEDAQKMLKEGDEAFIKFFGQNISNKKLIRLFAKLDTRVYSGDMLQITKNIKNLRGFMVEENIDFGEKELIEVNRQLQWLAGIINEVKANAPRNLGGDLPIQVEHITNDVITYPNRDGMNLYSLAKYNTSRNNKIYEAQYTIGKLLNEPPDVIRGSKVKNFVNDPKFKSKFFVPIKLNGDQYNDMKKYINTTVINIDGKNVNLNDALLLYINGEIAGEKNGFSLRAGGSNDYSYKNNKAMIEKYGLSSPQGQEAAERIFYELNNIHRGFVDAGIEEYLKANFTEEELMNRINIKVNQYDNYNKELETILDQFNFKQF